MDDIKFDLKDISIIPAVESHVNSRKDIDIRVKFSKKMQLPLMAAPMDTVINNDNLERFIIEGIIPCMPRKSKNNSLPKSQYFQSFGLTEIESQLSSKDIIKNPFWEYDNILIDIANGHMLRLVNVVKIIKQKFPKIKLMVGNVGHPYTYDNLAREGADYVRCSIGTGAGCTTAANVAINYPLGSLISECRKLKESGKYKTKIVADGGMQGYDDIIKALALGADYVMIGSLFNKTMQSAGFNYIYKIKIPYDLAKTLWKWGFPVKKKYRGMSTKAVQRKWGKAELTTAEGITKYQKIEYNLTQWVKNFEDYLKSNMSYCGTWDLEDFIGKVKWVYITNNALKRFQK